MKNEHGIVMLESQEEVENIFFSCFEWISSNKPSFLQITKCFRIKSLPFIEISVNLQIFLLILT